MVGFDYKNAILVISRELFYVLTGALIIFALLEVIWPGIVLAYINLNWLLIFWLLLGIIIISVAEE